MSDKKHVVTVEIIFHAENPIAAQRLCKIALRTKGFVDFKVTGAESQADQEFENEDEDDFKGH